MRVAVFLIYIALCALAMACLSWAKGKDTNAGLPLVRAAIPVAQPEVIPWVLNTRCGVTSRNLPMREREVRS